MARFLYYLVNTVFTQHVFLTKFLTNTKTQIMQQPQFKIGTDLKTFVNSVKHNGSQRSFAMNLKGEMIKVGVPETTAHTVAWDVARAVKNSHGDNYKTEYVVKSLKPYIIEDAKLFVHGKEGGLKVKKAVKRNKVDKPVQTMDASILKILNNEDLSKNERIRAALLAGASMTGVANHFGMQFQRVKNVKKDMIKRNLWVEPTTK